MFVEVISFQKILVFLKNTVPKGNIVLEYLGNISCFLEFYLFYCAL